MQADPIFPWIQLLEGTFSHDWLRFPHTVTSSFSTLGKFFRRHFFQKTGFDFSCKLSPMKTICMKSQIQFSGKNKKNILNMLFAEFAWRVVRLIVFWHRKVAATFMWIARTRKGLLHFILPSSRRIQKHSNCSWEKVLRWTYRQINT